MNLTLLALSLASTCVFASADNGTVALDVTPTDTASSSYFPKFDMSKYTSGMSKYTSGMTMPKMPSWEKDDATSTAPKEKKSIRKNLASAYQNVSASAAKAKEDLDKSEFTKSLATNWNKTKDYTERAAVLAGTKTIHSAVKAGNLEEVKRLISLGANPNKLNITTNHAPIHLAVKNCNIPMIEYLISVGADCNVRGGVQYRTPLHYSIDNCCDGNSTAVIEKLLSTGGLNLEITDFDGSTALSLAIKKDKEDYVKLLLEAGARILNVPNSQNENIKSMITEKFLKEIRPSASSLSSEIEISSDLATATANAVNIV